MRQLTLQSIQRDAPFRAADPDASSLEELTEGLKHYDRDGNTVGVTAEGLRQLLDDANGNARVRRVDEEALWEFLKALQAERRRLDVLGDDYNPDWAHVDCHGGFVASDHSPGAPCTFLTYSYGQFRATRGTAYRADDGPTGPIVNVRKDCVLETLGPEQYADHWSNVRLRRSLEAEMQDEEDG
jgi:hypothetical protein